MGFINTRVVGTAETYLVSLYNFWGQEFLGLMGIPVPCGQRCRSVDLMMNKFIFGLWGAIVLE